MGYQLMTRPTITIHDTATDKVITREMDDAEFEQHKIDLAAAEARKADVIAKETAKAALLERLGISADEMKILLS